jgi:hypothetical protein
MPERSWRVRAIDMRLWATRMTDPYTKIEMMALADVYDQRADLGGSQYLRRLSLRLPRGPRSSRLRQASTI